MFLADAAASEITRKVDDAMLWIGGVCLFFLVGITLTMLIFAVKYHRKRNPKPRQIHGNLPLEVTWIVIPTLIVLWMFAKGYEGFRYMRDVPDDAMTVEVLAQSWNWTFRYPEQDVTDSRLFVPVGKPVRLKMTSAPGDVIHSFYLPAFRVKEDCVPGLETYMWFRPERTGSYNIFCAEFCGKDHAKMYTSLEVVPEEEFRTWLALKVDEKNKPVDVAQAMDPGSEEIRAREGGKLYETFCASCHGKNGEGGLVGGARDFRQLDGWKRSPKIVDIFRTLSEGIDGTQMRSFQNLPAWDRFALAHHVKSFYKGSDWPESTPEDVAALTEEYRLGEKPVERETIPVEQAMEAIAGGAKDAGDAGSPGPEDSGADDGSR